MKSLSVLSIRTVDSNYISYSDILIEGVMPQSHTQIRTLTESFGSNRSRPQINEGGA